MLMRSLAVAIAAGVLLSVPGPAAQAGDKAPWIHVNVSEKGKDEATININLPLSLLEVALDVAEDEILAEGHMQIENCDLSVADMRRMWHELREAGDAEFITVEEKDETVRIYRKNKYLYVEVDDRASKDEKVRIEVPLSVVDALFETDNDNAINLRGALAELERTKSGDILNIQDGDSRVRIWID